MGGIGSQGCGSCSSNSSSGSELLSSLGSVASSGISAASSGISVGLSASSWLLGKAGEKVSSVLSTVQDSAASGSAPSDSIHQTAADTSPDDISDLLASMGRSNAAEPPLQRAPSASQPSSLNRPSKPAEPARDDISDLLASMASGSGVDPPIRRAPSTTHAPLVEPATGHSCGSSCTPPSFSEPVTRGPVSSHHSVISPTGSGTTKLRAKATKTDASSWDDWGDDNW